MQNLSVVANLGLILFLFLVGLEVNMKLFVSNWRVALSVGLAGMVLPFGLGCAIAWGLYNQFRNDPGTVTISFGVYMLFIGTALSVRNTGLMFRGTSTLTHSDHCISRSMPNPYRIKAPWDPCRRNSISCWCRKRCHWLDTSCTLCCTGQ